MPSSEMNLSVIERPPYRSCPRKRASSSLAPGFPLSAFAEASAKAESGNPGAKELDARFRGHERYGGRSMTDKFISLEGIAKRYPAPGGTTTVFENLWLAMKRGEFTCIIGHSGC